MIKTDALSNKAIAHLFRSIAGAYLIKNENRFKIIAYEKAADTVEHLNRELKDLWQEGKLKGTPGIGPSIFSSLDELFSTGKSQHFEKALSGVPPPVFQLMTVPSIGPKKAIKLVTALKLEHSNDIFADLKKAAQDNKIAKIETFGEKSQQDILEALERYKGGHREDADRMPLPYAYTLAQEISNYLKQLPEVKRVDALGSLRRMVSTIGDIDLAVVADIKSADKIIKHFLQYPGKIAIDNAGEEKASIIVSPHIRVDLRIQEENNYGSMLQYFTGNKAHNIKLREYAMKKDYSLSEHGIKNVKTGKVLQFKDEPTFYNFLGVDYVEPELREGTNEIDLGIKHKLPQLVTPQDIKGDLHLHSSYDLQPSHDAGSNSYLEIVEKGQSLGYEYVGFADHNPKTSGMTDNDIIAIMKKRKKDIQEMFKGKKYKTKYFIGLEVDILPNGELAFPEEAIEYLDYMIISVHSSFHMGIEDMTKRVLKAMSYPKVKILGHPTGRLLGKRPGFELEWQKIFEYAKSKDIAMEINSWYQRLDLPDMLVREAKLKGLKLVIDTDAHAVDQMNQQFYGVSVARRGWCIKSDIINTEGYGEFKKWIENY